MNAPGNVEHNMLCGNDESPTNAILRILKKHMPHIISGHKNHEYRTYRLDEQVTRVWLYVDEDKEIQYVLTIGPPKVPGEVNDPEGLGNDDFDLGLKKSGFGYPIMALHMLPRALTADTLIHDYGVDMNTKGKQYVKQCLVDTFPTESLVRIIPKQT
ncbi:hypothetical protein LXA43DRAFT_1105218 [Ganoderma leucocontextum]|nr:hypothetical protein LXA43DRAFT_1105218 [Ganoderma leucocontextum]